MKQAIDNPLLHPIRSLLANAEGPFGEHELIKRLQTDENAFPEMPESDRLALFQTHFLVMNALYQLQDQLFSEGLHLHISPLKIFIQPLSLSGSSAPAEATSQAALKSYYTDWQHYQSTSEGDVEALFSQFWSYYLTEDRQGEAYRVLELPAGASWPEVQSAYRRLAGLLHPDRGGDAADFMRVREAYEVLARSLKGGAGAAAD